MPVLATRPQLSRIERTRRAALQARARGHAPQSMPAQLPPTRIEDGYAHRLRSHVRRAIAVAYAPLLRELPGLVSRARAERGDNADWRSDASNSGRAASALIRSAHRDMARALRSVAAGEARGAAKDVDDHVRVQLGGQVRAVLGVGLAGDERIKPVIGGFVHENIKLITGLTPRLAADIEGAVQRALTTGQLHEDLARVIADRLGISERRAELIAIDQVGKLNGQLNIQRQKDLGLAEFIWQTVEDERVRGNPLGKYPNAVPSHYDRNGKRYSMDDPPRGTNGEREYPGTPIRCRCSGTPVLDAVLPDAAPEGQPVAGPIPDLDIDALEAEAARLMREVEAMMAAQVRPAAPVVVAVQAAPEPEAQAPSVDAAALAAFRDALVGVGVGDLEASIDAVESVPDPVPGVPKDVVITELRAAIAAAKAERARSEEAAAIERAGIAELKDALVGNTAAALERELAAALSSKDPWPGVPKSRVIATIREALDAVGSVVAPANQAALVKLPAPPASTFSQADQDRYKSLAFASVRHSRDEWDEHMREQATSPDANTYVMGRMTYSIGKFRAERAEFAKTLDDKAVDASVFYSHQGDRLLNTALREDRLDSDPDLKAQAAELDSVIASNEIKTETYVSRGMSGPWADGFLSAIAPGSEFIEPGYMSTSATTPFSGAVMLRIKLPPGSKAAPIPSRHYDEDEFLLPRGSRFRVLSITRGDVRSTVELELVPAGP